MLLPIQVGFMSVNKIVANMDTILREAYLNKPEIANNPNWLSWKSGERKS
jgi:hypothetical protein